MRKPTLLLSLILATTFTANISSVHAETTHYVVEQSLSTTSIGFGQGKRVDENNCPCDALDFTNHYSKYGACAVNDEENRIILTFDQGYENGYTPKILDTLKEKGVQAIFFLTGDYAKKEPELVKRMIDEGHTLGNHGMKHLSLPTLNENGFNEEIMSLHNYVLDEYGYEMQYLRPPCGEYSEQSLEFAHKNGYKTLFWSYAYVDWMVDKQPEPSTSLENLVNSAHSGEIILLHSVSKTNAEILDDAIDRIRDKGFKI